MTTPEQLAQDALNENIITSDKQIAVEAALKNSLTNGRDLVTSCEKALQDLETARGGLTVRTNPAGWIPINTLYGQGKAEKQNYKLSQLIVQQRNLEERYEENKQKLNDIQTKKARYTANKQQLETKWQSVLQTNSVDGFFSNMAFKAQKAWAKGRLAYVNSHIASATKIESQKNTKFTESSNRLQESMDATKTLYTTYETANKEVQTVLKTIRSKADMVTLRSTYDTVEIALAATPPLAVTDADQRAHDLYEALQNPSGAAPATIDDIIAELLRDTPWGNAGVNIATAKLSRLRGDMNQNLWWARPADVNTASKRKVLGNDLQKLLDAREVINANRNTITELERIDAAKDHAHALFQSVIQNNTTKQTELRNAEDILDNFGVEDRPESNAMIYQNPTTGEWFTVASELKGGKRQFRLPDGSAATNREEALLAARKDRNKIAVQNILYAGGTPAIPANFDTTLTGIYAPFSFTSAIKNKNTPPASSSDMLGLNVQWSRTLPKGGVETGTFTLEADEIPVFYVGGTANIDTRVPPAVPEASLRSILDRKMESVREKERKADLLTLATINPVVKAEMENAFSTHMTASKGFTITPLPTIEARPRNVSGTPPRAEGVELAVRIPGTLREEVFPIAADDIKIDTKKLLRDPTADPEIDTSALERVMEPHAVKIASLLDGEQFQTAEPAFISAELQKDIKTHPLLSRAAMSTGSNIITYHTATPPSTPARIEWGMDRFANVGITNWTSKSEKPDKLVYKKDSNNVIVGIDTKGQLDAMAKQLEPLDLAIKDLARIVTNHLRSQGTDKQLTGAIQVEYDVPSAEYILVVPQSGRTERFGLKETEINVTWGKLLTDPATLPDHWFIDEAPIAFQNFLTEVNDSFGSSVDEFDEEIKNHALLQRTDSTVTYDNVNKRYEWTMTTFSGHTLTTGAWNNKELRKLPRADVLANMVRKVNELDKKILGIDSSLMTALKAVGTPPMDLSTEINGRPRVRYDTGTERYLVEIERKKSGVKEIIPLDDGNLNITTTPPPPSRSDVWDVSPTASLLNKLYSNLSITKQATTLTSDLRTAIQTDTTLRSAYPATAGIPHTFEIVDNTSNGQLELHWSMPSYKHIPVTGLRKIKIPLDKKMLDPVTGVVTKLKPDEILDEMEKTTGSITRTIDKIPTKLRTELMKIHNFTKPGTPFTAPAISTVNKGSVPYSISITVPGSSPVAFDLDTDVSLHWNASSETWEIDIESLANSIYSTL